MTHTQWNLVLRDQIEYRVEKGIQSFFLFLYFNFDVTQRIIGKILTDVSTFFELVLSFLHT
jgi:hypothetical protein